MLSYGKLNEIWEKHGVFEKLSEKYEKQINEEFDFNSINNELDKDPSLELLGDDSNKYKALYICSWLSIIPSGKYYMPWCSNFTTKEALRDQIYLETLENVLDQHNLWYESGEGDPTDVYFCKAYNMEE